MAVEKVDIQTFLELSRSYHVFDVRSPGEFRQAHIPGAYNLPLFTDEERKVVGTAYNHQGREAAIKIGLDYFGPKMRKMVEEVEGVMAIDKRPPQINDPTTVLIHCWRGGMRSGAIAWLLDLYGFKVYTLTGGYKKFRRYVLETFTQAFQFKLLGGLTGSGKTLVLHELANHGEAIIDLEGLANHKGSAFGALGQPAQPSQEMFENLLALELRKNFQGYLVNQPSHQPGPVTRPIWVEDESQRIGSLIIPPPVWKQMRSSSICILDVPFSARLKHIQAGYGNFEKGHIRDAILRIQKRLGGMETKMAMEFLAENNIEDCFTVLLKYYDKCYLKSLQGRDTPTETLVCEKVDHTANSQKLVELLLNTNPEQTVKFLCTMIDHPIRLTQFSHGAGCGCKISPKVLDQILKTNLVMPDNDKLIVGNHTKDDAAIYDIGNGIGLVATTDFFMPIVDDPFDFGQIASANAISDVYAMGGKPVLAIAILGWPINHLPAEAAQRVIEGSRHICKKAGIALAGGHSIDCPEPVFGLAVNGMIPMANIKQNNRAKEGNYLFLTKPLGVGILTTAEKKELLKEEHRGMAARQMMQLNAVGEALGALACVTAMTDVTGFGLLGHLIEMAEGSNLSARTEFHKIPLITDHLPVYIEHGSVPGGTHRNWESYGDKIAFMKNSERNYQKSILADPQTSGGLLIAVAPTGLNEFTDVLKAHGLSKFAEPIGWMTEKNEHVVTVA